MYQPFMTSWRKPFLTSRSRWVRDRSFARIAAAPAVFWSSQNLQRLCEFFRGSGHIWVLKLAFCDVRFLAYMVVSVLAYHVEEYLAYSAARKLAYGALPFLLAAPLNIVGAPVS